MKPIDDQELTLEQALTKPTITVPEAGRIFFGGLTKNAAYAAARRGDIPTLKVGRRHLALTKAIAEKFGLQVKF